MRMRVRLKTHKKEQHAVHKHQKYPSYLRNIDTIGILIKAVILTMTCRGASWKQAKTVTRSI